MNANHKATALLVDDEPANLKLMEILLQSDGYHTLSAESGTKALLLINLYSPDIILLDIMMAGMDGFELAQQLKSNPDTCNIPIIMITGLCDHESRLRALKLGVEEFLTKPFDRIELQIRVKNLLKLKEYANFLLTNNERLEAQVASRTAQLAESQRECIHVMTAAAEHKDEDTGLHISRISHYCRMLSEHLGMDAHFVSCIFYASPMHDIGKIGIPDQILLKPGPHTDQEWEIMKSHTLLGEEILRKGKSPFILMGAEIALNHHERWDGSGYPEGKRGNDIPLSARLMNIADQYDALRAKRPYKSALDHDKVVQIITTGDDRTSPRHFDPEVLEAFKRCSGKFREIYAEQTL